MSQKITCDLAENALDYLCLAGEMAKQGSHRMLKHSVAMLADGIELLLKARLEVYDWTLIFKNIDDADNSKLQCGDFSSVTFDQAVKRLKNICGIDLDPKTLAILDNLRRLRNQIRHFAITVEKTEAISLLVKTYSFSIDFTTKHLEEYLGDTANNLLDSLRRVLGEFQDFVQARLEVIKPVLDGQTYVNHIDCPKCFQLTLYSDDGTASCAFCGYSAKGEEAAHEWAFQFRPGSMKDRMIDPAVEPCPECKAEACVRLDDSETYQCLCCGASGTYDHCSSCGTLYAGDEYGGRCRNCFNALAYGDD